MAKGDIMQKSQLRVQQCDDIFRAKAYPGSWITLCIAYLHILFTSHDHHTLKQLRFRSRSLMTRSKKEKSPWVKSKSKPGPKKSKSSEESFDSEKRSVLAADAEPCCFTTSALPDFARNSALFPFRLGSKDKECDLFHETPRLALSRDSFGGPTPFLIGPRHDSRWLCWHLL